MTAAAPPRVTSNLRALCALVALSFAAFSFITTELLPVGLLPLISHDLHTSLSVTGLLMTAYAATVAVCSVPLTLMTRRVPRRRLLVTLLSVFVVATWVSVAATSYWVLLGARVSIALTHGLFWSIVAATTVGLFEPQRRARVLLVLFTSGSFATVLGVPAGTWLGQQAGWRVAFLVISALGLVSLAAIAASLPAAGVEQTHATFGRRPDARRYGILILATSFAVSGLFTSYTYISAFLTDISGFSPAAIGPVLLSGGAAGFVGVTVVGLVADRHPRASLIVPVALLAAALLGLYELGDTRPLAVAFVALTGLGIAAFATALQNRVFDVAPGRSDVAAAGTASAFNVGIGGGALVGALLLPSHGVRSTALVGGLLTVVALVALLAESLVAPRPRAES